MASREELLSLNNGDWGNFAGYSVGDLQSVYGGTAQEWSDKFSSLGMGVNSSGAVTGYQAPRQEMTWQGAAPQANSYGSYTTPGGNAPANFDRATGRLATPQGGYIDFNAGRQVYADGSSRELANDAQGRQYALNNLWNQNLGLDPNKPLADMGYYRSDASYANQYGNAIGSNGGWTVRDPSTAGQGQTTNWVGSNGSSGNGQPIAYKPGVNWQGGQSGTGGATQGQGGSGQYYGAGENPYLRQMGDWLTSQMTQNFQQKVMPALNSGAMASGGFGGSRHGVIEANAQNDLQSQIGGALTNLYGQGYNTGLQYDLGIRGNELGYANLDRQINNDNLNWQLQGANFGLGLYDRINNNYGGMYGVGSNIQNTPMNYWQNFANQANGLGNGFNGQAVPVQGNPIMGAMGGMQAGQALGNYWNTQPTSNSFGGTNSQGWGTGSGYGNQDYGQFL